VRQRIKHHKNACKRVVWWSLISLFRTPNVYEKKPIEDANYLENFWVFWNQNYKTLLKQCHYILQNKTDAEEALSIAMMKLIGYWNEKEPELRNPKAWASTVVRNVCKDIQRQNFRRSTREMTQHNDDQTHYVEESRTSDERLPFETIESREICGMIMECMRDLPETIMTTAIMRFRDDLDYKDIAEILDIQENTARKRVEYARHLLTSKLIIQSLAKR
jgi:RNA polymerase sigma factor (sigma-70 family)